MSRYELNQAIDEVIDALESAGEKLQAGWPVTGSFEREIEKLDALRDRLMHEGLI